MTIQYIDPDTRWSEATIYNKTLYYTAVPENLESNAKAQTENVLTTIDAMLTRAGSDKTKLLDVTIFLADRRDFTMMNEAWDAWVVPHKAPVRCTIEAALMNPAYKIEIKIIAACE